MSEIKEKMLERFLKYVTFDTESCDDATVVPTTEGQFVFARYLEQQLKDMGLEDVVLDEKGYLYATLPANCDKDVPAIGFIAHADTAPDASGADVKPQIIENYDGGEIPLKGVPGLSLKPSEFPELELYKGQTLITTDGTTLLGADDKAGIAEIMDAVQYIVEHPEFKHGEIKIGFTPDEEIGRGVVKFDVAKFGAKYAYTLDGGQVGELEYENFNAAGATIRIQGRNVHPGTAKGKMKNAILIGMELNALLPVEQRPEYTCGYEGFFHLISFKGEVETATFSYIIRDHDAARFEGRKAQMKHIEKIMNHRWGEGTVTVHLREQYRNMREMVEPKMYIIDLVKSAMEQAGVQPKVKPIRGGTDGARLTFEGIITPNLGTGGQNFHGPFEYLDVTESSKMVEVVKTLVQKFN